jgi:hypothetical protein
MDTPISISVSQYSLKLHNGDRLSRKKLHINNHVALRNGGAYAKTTI